MLSLVSGNLENQAEGCRRRVAKYHETVAEICNSMVYYNAMIPVSTGFQLNNNIMILISHFGDITGVCGLWNVPIAIVMLFH